MKSLAILAGGKSTRMGTDKAFLKIDKATFLERIFADALYCFEKIYISVDTKEHANEIKKIIPQANIIIDKYAELGPIGAIATLLEEIDEDKIALVPTDVPEAALDVLSLLIDECDGKACCLKLNEKIEPLLAVYSKETLPLLKEAINNNEFSLFKVLKNEYKTLTKLELIKKYPYLKQVDFKKSFRNINCPEDYKRVYESN